MKKVKYKAHYSDGSSEIIEVIVCEDLGESLLVKKTEIGQRYYIKKSEIIK